VRPAPHTRPPQLYPHLTAQYHTPGPPLTVTCSVTPYCYTGWLYLIAPYRYAGHLHPIDSYCCAGWLRSTDSYRCAGQLRSVSYVQSVTFGQFLQSVTFGRFLRLVTFGRFLRSIPVVDYVWSIPAVNSCLLLCDCGLLPLVGIRLDVHLTAMQDDFILVLYEIWIILKSFPTKFPALRQFYETAVTGLSSDQIEALAGWVECQKVCFLQVV